MLPPLNAERLFDAAGTPKDQKELVILATADHNTCFEQKEYWARKGAFLARLPKI